MPELTRCLTQDVKLLISQYLNDHHTSLARQFDEEVLGESRNDLFDQRVEEVERAILGTCLAKLE